MFTEAVECLRKGDNLPKRLCYVPKTLVFELTDVKDVVPIYEEPKTASQSAPQTLRGENEQSDVQGPASVNLIKAAVDDVCKEI